MRTVDSRKGSVARRIQRVVGTGVLATLALGGIGALATSQEANAIFAAPDTSDGEYTQIIDWVQWGNQNNEIVLQNGSSEKVVRSTRKIGTQTLEVACTIDSLQHLQPQQTGQNGSNTGQILTPPLVAYAPGSWAGDALDNLYNIGGRGYATHANNPVFPADFRNPNEMVIGLANPNPGVMGGANIAVTEAQTNGARMQFDFSCSANLDGTPVPLDGLVFADAEASSSRNTSNTQHNNGPEWVQATPHDPNNTTWRLLEEARSCTDANAEASWPATNSLRLGVDGQECVYQGVGNQWPNPDPNGYGPVAVAFMDNNTPTSTMGARVELQGRGYSAVALGYVMSADFGDAPESYGEAGALFQPDWDGGVIQPGRTQNLSTAAQAEYGLPQHNILGETIDPESEHQYSAGADADNLNGQDDEDGLDGSSLAASEYELPISAFDGSSSTYTVNDVTCYGSDRGTSQVYSWIDWNADGVFDESERSDAATCPSGGPHNIDVTWELPEDLNPEADHTFMRLRIAEVTATGGDAAQVAEPTGMTLTGEVEDYRLKFPARVKVDKQWVVNGVEFQHGEQPEGIDASPTLSPDHSPAVTWNEWQRGYRTKDVVTIGESVDPVPQGCEVTQSVLTGDGIANPSSVDLNVGTETADVQLQKIHNEYMITNHVECKQHLTLVKELDDQLDNPEKSPQDWDLSATLQAQSNTGTLPGADAVKTGTTTEVSANVDYKLSETGPNTYIATQEGWQCVDNRTDATVELTDDLVSLDLGQDATCTITNTTAKLTILKHVEGGNAVPQDWELSATPGQNDYGFTTHTTPGAQNVSSNNTWEVRPEQPFALDEALANTDPDALKEYYLDRIEMQDENGAWVEVTDTDAVTVPAGTHAVYRFVNAAIPSLEIPLTGGLGRDAYLIGGGVVLVLTTGLVLWGRRTQAA